MVRTPLNSGRPGVTLTEVLVAMFVMAIGMISLLTLFPLGAMQVGQALRDDRCTQLARQADGYMRDHWRTNVVARTANSQDVVEPYFWAMDDPNLVVKQAYASNTSLMTYIGSPAASLFNTANVLPAGEIIPQFGPAPQFVSRLNLGNDTTVTAPPSPGPGQFYANYQTPRAGGSYPVMLDLTATISRTSSNTERYWVAGYGAGNQVRIPRRTSNAVQGINSASPSTALAFELGSLTDDMTFAPNGAPAATELGRQGRYTWTAILQRPRNDARTVADLTILVYDSRSQLPQTGDELVVVPDTGSAVGERTVRITLPNRTGDTSPVLLRRGGWLIDGTVDSASPFRRQFIAYRVSGFTEVTVGATTTQYDVDLESPLKANLTPVPTAAGDPPASQLYLFAGLIEVFTRPQLRPDTAY